MKKNVFCLILTIAVIASSCEKKAELSSFAWLEGKWVGRYDSASAFEQWKITGEKSMHGAGGVLSGKDTVMVERISIEERSEGLFYMASVDGNPKAAEFKFSGFKNDTAVFENPQHDFPQRILYIKNGEDTFYACVDGKYKGKYIREEFNYKKAQN
ncbi:MAG: hypothetical protein K0Q95_134 [Bacteroidota bacterium]|nr:hypothetical protein [Bacteroidota bacterium]